MTAAGPNHQQPRTNKRKAESDVSLVLIKRVNLALGLMGGSQRSPLGPPSGSGLRVTQRGPGRAGWGAEGGSQPCRTACHARLVTHLSSLSPSPWPAASTSPSRTLLRFWGGMGRSAPPPPASPARGSRCAMERPARLGPRAHARAHARPAHSSRRGGPSGQAEAPTLLSRSSLLGPGPQVLQPTLGAPVSAVVKEDERAA